MYGGILEEALEEELEKVHEHVGSPRGTQGRSYRSIGTFNILQVTAPEWGHHRRTAAAKIRRPCRSGAC